MAEENEDKSCKGLPQQDTLESAGLMAKAWVSNF